VQLSGSGNIDRQRRQLKYKNCLLWTPADYWQWTAYAATGEL